MFLCTMLLTSAFGQASSEETRIGTYEISLIEYPQRIELVEYADGRFSGNLITEMTREQRGEGSKEIVDKALIEESLVKNLMFELRTNGIESIRSCDEHEECNKLQFLDGSVVVFKINTPYVKREYQFGEIYPMKDGNQEQDDLRFQAQKLISIIYDQIEPKQQFSEVFKRLPKGEYSYYQASGNAIVTILNNVDKEDIPVTESDAQNDCEHYWNRRFPDASVKAGYLSEIFSKNEIPENNRRFLNALKNEKQDDLAYKNILSPIFRLSETEIGILAFPEYKETDDGLVIVSPEKDFIEKFDTISTKPIVNYYTTDRIGTTQILELGAYKDDCLEYYEYSIDTSGISINDKVLFSSPFVIDLVFKNYPQVDSLLKADYIKECQDCPNSTRFQKTFAKVKGTDHLYFVYADTFPINKELDTPSRALILVNPDKEIIYLWYEELDLFGCSCL